MKWASAVSESEDLEEAVRDCAGALVEELQSSHPDLAIAFISRHHADAYEELPQVLADILDTRVTIGCSAGAVIGGGHEVENKAGFSLTAAVLPDVELYPFHLETTELPDLDSSPKAWEELTGIPTEKQPNFLLLPDPFTFDAESFIMGLDFAYPGNAKVGGLASGATGPGENILCVSQGGAPAELFRSGVIGLGMCGNIAVETIVAQGCRPIGEPFEITKCQQNLLIELDDRAPLELLEEVFANLSDRDKELFNHSLFIGIVMDEHKDEVRQGDFLIRNIIGLDRSSGSLAIGALLHENQVVQFHLRDALTSAEDLQHLLARHASKTDRSPAAGGLLFSCLGRGSYLYGEPDHDTRLFRNFLGNIPLGGFFCNGEIGPVSGTTYLHGYTSSFGLFRPVR